jgi:hypothetical protein
MLLRRNKDEAAEGGNIVFRLLRADEDPTQGLFAKLPGFQYPKGVNTHVLHGSRPWFRGDKWISTARDPAALLPWAKPGQTLVRIDLDKSMDTVVDIIDLSVPSVRQQLLSGRSIGYAKESTEVLVEGVIGPNSIVRTTFEALGL